MSRLYAGLAIVALIMFAAYKYQSAVNDRDKYQAALAVADANLSKQKQVTEKERSNAESANKRAIENEAKANEVTSQINVMRTCIDAGTCGVRIKYQSCPRMPSNSTDASRPQSNEADAGHRRLLEQDYFNLLEAIRLTKVRYEAQQRDIAVRSHPDYCKLINKNARN